MMKSWKTFVIIMLMVMTPSVCMANSVSADINAVSDDSEELLYDIRQEQIGGKYGYRTIEYLRKGEVTDYIDLAIVLSDIEHDGVSGYDIEYMTKGQAQYCARQEDFEIVTLASLSPTGTSRLLRLEDRDPGDPIFKVCICVVAPDGTVYKDETKPTDLRHRVTILDDAFAEMEKKQGIQCGIYRIEIYLNNRKAYSEEINVLDDPTAVGFIFTDEGTDLFEDKECSIKAGYIPAKAIVEFIE